MGSLKWELADCSVAFSTMILMVSSDRKKSAQIGMDVKIKDLF